MRLSVLKKDENISFEKLRLVLVILVAPTIVFPNIVYGEEQDFYCMEFYDEYREIGYPRRHAKKVIFARDYEYGSGDANYLNISHDVPDEFMDETDKGLVTHFNRMFRAKKVIFARDYIWLWRRTSIFRMIFRVSRSFAEPSVP